MLKMFRMCFLTLKPQPRSLKNQHFYSTENEYINIVLYEEGKKKEHSKFNICVWLLVLLFEQIRND